MLRVSDKQRESDPLPCPPPWSEPVNPANQSLDGALIQPARTRSPACGRQERLPSIGGGAAGCWLRKLSRVDERTSSGVQGSHTALAAELSVRMRREALPGSWKGLQSQTFSVEQPDRSSSSRVRSRSSSLAERDPLLAAFSPDRFYYRSLNTREHLITCFVRSPAHSPPGKAASAPRRLLVATESPDHAFCAFRAAAHRLCDNDLKDD